MEGSPRSNRAQVVIRTGAAPSTGTYQLVGLDALTAGGKWLAVSGYPATTLAIAAEPASDTASYQTMSVI